MNHSIAANRAFEESPNEKLVTLVFHAEIRVSINSNRRAISSVVDKENEIIILETCFLRNNSRSSIVTFIPSPPPWRKENGYVLPPSRTRPMFPDAMEGRKGGGEMIVHQRELTRRRPN